MAFEIHGNVQHPGNGDPLATLLDMHDQIMGTHTQYAEPSRKRPSQQRVGRHALCGVANISKVSRGNLAAPTLD